jgi:hypothetical protein
MHFTEDVTGDVLDCGDTTYTVVSGEIAIVLHEERAPRATPTSPAP